MKKLKYGLLLILSMILFSVPVLAAKTTYYLPSEIEGKSIDNAYRYDKYGQLSYLEGEDDENEYDNDWTYKYGKNGKRVSGENCGPVDDVDKLTFDKNGYLQSSRLNGGKKIIYYWNKQGYLAKRSDGKRYTYFFSSNGQLKKSAYYRNGKKQSVSYYNKDGLLTKTVSSISKETITYEYKYNKNGLVSTIIKTTNNNGKKSVDNIKVSYSKTKTDKKTYTLFINGHDTCYDNPVL